METLDMLESNLALDSLKQKAVLQRDPVPGATGAILLEKPAIACKTSLEPIRPTLQREGHWKEQTVPGTPVRSKTVRFAEEVEYIPDFDEDQLYAPPVFRGPLLNEPNLQRMAFGETLNVHPQPGSGLRFRLKSVADKSLLSCPTDNLIPTGLTALKSGAFAHRYDFGASLTAAIKRVTALETKGEKKDGFYAAPWNSEGPQSASENTAVTAPETSKPLLPLHDALASSSASYEDIVNKYCFVRTTTLNPSRAVDVNDLTTQLDSNRVPTRHEASGPNDEAPHPTSQQATVQSSTPPSDRQALPLSSRPEDVSLIGA
jgi:hypothetical protein